LCEQVFVNLDEMRRLRLGSTARWIIVCVALALVAAGVFLFWPGQTPVAEPVPSPNGYDDLRKAAGLLARNTFEVRDLAEGELREMVTQNGAALKLLRSAIDHECRVPVEYSKTYIEKHLPELSGLKVLARALLAEGRVAELDQRTNDAARCYLDAIRLGHEAARGGMQIDHLVGVACEAMGSLKLTKIVPALNAKECRAAIAPLESIENKRELTEETLRIERAFARTEGMKQRISSMINWKSLDPVKQWHRKYLVRLQGEIARQSQLRVDLARRAYELENGKPPADLHVLVPAYLKSLPQVQPSFTNASSGPLQNR
jgi:hypothetical protein